MTKGIELHWDSVDARIGREAANELYEANRRRIIIMRICEGVIGFGILTFLMLLLGCKATLDTSGAYGTNQFLFNADKVIVDSKADLNGFVTWEMQNRTAITQQKLQAITAAADAIRTNAPLWFSVAVAARNTYSNAWAMSAPTVTASSNSLQSSITLLQTQTLATQAITNSVKLQ